MKERRVGGRLHLLTVREVQNASSGDYSDGGGLTLRVRDNSASWVFRYSLKSGKRREMGLGPCYRQNSQTTGQSIVCAREDAENARRQLRDGIDPIEARQEARRAAREAEEARKAQARRERSTLCRVARAYHERVVEPARAPKHAAQWISSLENNVPASIWDKPIAEVTAIELLDAIAELQTRVPETASRVRQRLEVVFDDAEFRGYCKGNPARAIRRKLREGRKRREKGAFAALDYRKAPEFFRRVQQREGIAARALEFAILTTARTGEVIGATWDEVDLDAGTWTVPGRRMKSGEPHVVYLTSRALEILHELKVLEQQYIFPSPLMNGKPLSNMAMLTLLRRLDVHRDTTVHGLCRSTFSTWANDLGIARPDVIEACLAHQEQNRVRAAYNRASFAQERRRLLQRWSEYLAGMQPASNILDLALQRVVAGESQVVRANVASSI